jgi:hypothetical protein
MPYTRQDAKYDGVLAQGFAVERSMILLFMTRIYLPYLRMDNNDDEIEQSRPQGIQGTSNRSISVYDSGIPRVPSTLVQVNGSIRIRISCWCR